MKRILALLLVIAMGFSMAGCGGGDEESTNEADTSNEPVAEEQIEEEPIVQKTERSVDAVAKAIGIDGEGEETFYDMIGAKAGKEFNGGGIEIYQYEPDSEAYKAFEEKGEYSELKASAVNDGFVLLIVEGDEPDMVTKFKELQF